MANTLLDAIKKNQNAAIAAPAAATGSAAPSETQSLADTLAIGQTGKAAPTGMGGSPKMSNLQERIAAVQTKLGTDALAQETSQAQTGMEQDAEIAKRESEIQDTALEQHRQQTQQDYTQRVQATLDNYTQQGRQLDLSKDKAKMEQIGFQLRLSNNQYIQDLKKEGIKSRLNSQLKRKEQIADTVFADEQEMMQNNIKFRQIMNAKGRDLQTQLSDIDLDFALQMADAENKAANERAMWQGIGGIATGVISGAGSMGAGAAGGGPTAAPGAEAASYTAAGSDYAASGGGYGGGGPR